jgi:hypothetical protein
MRDPTPRIPGWLAVLVVALLCPLAGVGAAAVVAQTKQAASEWRAAMMEMR